MLNKRLEKFILKPDRKWTVVCLGTASDMSVTTLGFFTTLFAGEEVVLPPGSRRKVWRGRQPQRYLEGRGGLNCAFSFSSTENACLDRLILGNLYAFSLHFSIWPCYVKLSSTLIVALFAFLIRNTNFHFFNPRAGLNPQCAMMWIQ